MYYYLKIEVFKDYRLEFSGFGSKGFLQLLVGVPAFFERVYFKSIGSTAHKFAWILWTTC